MGRLAAPLVWKVVAEVPSRVDVCTASAVAEDSCARAMHLAQRGGMHAGLGVCSGRRRRRWRQGRRTLRSRCLHPRDRLQGMYLQPMRTYTHIPMAWVGVAASCPLRWVVVVDVAVAMVGMELLLVVVVGMLWMKPLVVAPVALRYPLAFLSRKVPRCVYRAARQMLR